MKAYFPFGQSTHIPIVSQSPILQKLEHYLHLIIWTILNIEKNQTCQMSDKYSQMIHAIGHLMNLCVLSSNGMVQKKHVLDPRPRLLKTKLKLGAHES